MKVKEDIYYLGRKVDDLSREELLVAIKQLYETHRVMQASNKTTIELLRLSAQRARAA